MNQLHDSISTLTAHSAKCGGKCTIEGESMHSGLAVILQASCIKWGQILSIRTSPRVQTSSGKNGQKMNGQLGCSSWRNVHWWWFDTVKLYPGTYGCPWYAKANVHRHWRVWERNANTSYTINAGSGLGGERHAIAMRSFHQGIPSITVVVDGGWSKRSHKHSYNAKSGVAVIFRSHTRKLLFMGIRDKFCAVCAVQRINTWMSHNTNAIAIGSELQQPWRYGIHP